MLLQMLVVKPEMDLESPRTRFGKPKFPSIISLPTALSDLVELDWWFMFYILQLDPQLLTGEVENWKDTISYKTSLDNLQALNDVNDCAERGVKLTQISCHLLEVKNIFKMYFKLLNRIMLRLYMV